MSVSKRASESLSLTCPMFGAFSQTLNKMYNADTNPNGALNLGVAHNDLLQQKVFEKAKACLQLTPNDLNYGPSEGTQELRQLMKDFFTRHFHPYYPMNWTDIFVHTGAGASINQLFLSIGDPGDYCLIPTPFYGAFEYDVSVHTGIHILPVNLHKELQDMSIDPDQLESYYQGATSEGKKVTSMLITNPENPLAKCYSKKDIETILAFADRHHIHVVFDEIYALSTYSQFLDEKTEDPFVSVLSLPYKELIDPALVHVIYGLSKDFAVNGFRVGYVVNQFNGPLKQALRRSSAFSYLSTITDRLLCNMFSDTKWIDEYLLENRQALAASYTRTTEFLKSEGIDYIAAQAGPFLLVDIRNKLVSATSESDDLLWAKMLDGGVYLAKGSVFYIGQPGFFRLTFALPWDELHKGLTRFIKALQ
ncbi:pyridoxal phosphate-dependent transferase [Mucor mucedo]|uniref:pyridoxal phosphate-dependent transferase n=1 Tax=Mucor mucedo TaxID=29922 RepID=UPI00221F10D5|nr:pyridoxal phosphate-dependent transferase [Mucor mucedo]KAI7889371.1 pyridoxal phosphate-dependent transferase [Mucor mucedo]